MTTDNLANEPTDVMILAALNAYSSKGLEIDGYDPTDEYPSLDMWGERFASQMRAALVAAQVAAPQAEQATYLNVAHSSVLAGSINARRAAREVSAMQLIDAIYDPDEDDANDSVRYGYVLEQFERLRIIYADLDDPDAGPAPVLPSSGVDEDALAEAWEAGCLAGRNRKHHTNMTEEQAEKAWPNPCRAGQGESRG